MSPTPLRCAVTLVASLALVSVVNIARAQQVGDVFVIALENHNWTVSGSGYNGSNLALDGDPAAPYINSLVGGSLSLSSQVAYAKDYYNSGTGTHPSEPNYVWAEAGTNFNPISTGTSTSTNQGSIIGNTILSDNDPTAANKNIFPSSVPHLTQQMNNFGISWNNYQEDYQITNNTTPTGGSPTVTKSGNSSTVINPYYGTNQYNYEVKHNPMAFFADTQTENVRTFDQLRSDLSADTGTNPVNNFGRYNWITPNYYNDMHSALTGGFNYHGVAYTGDQAAVATGDNFLATVIPQITATQAYKNNGAIIIWNDETENGDTSANTSTEIVISPLAHPNVNGLPYGSTVPMSHSSDLKTMEEIFQLGSTLNNAIPNSETNTQGTGHYNTVSGSNDLSDLFAAGAIPSTVPEPSSATLLALAATTRLLSRRRRA